MGVLHGGSATIARISIIKKLRRRIQQGLDGIKEQFSHPNPQVFRSPVGPKLRRDLVLTTHPHALYQQWLSITATRTL